MDSTFFWVLLLLLFEFVDVQDIDALGVVVVAGVVPIKLIKLKLTYKGNQMYVWFPLPPLVTHYRTVPFASV